MFVLKFSAQALLLALVMHDCAGFAPSMVLKGGDHDVTRRALMCKAATLLASLPATLCTPPHVAASEDRENVSAMPDPSDTRPLTPEEMEEYERLLIQKQKIINVVEANKKAFMDGFERDVVVPHAANCTK